MCVRVLFSLILIFGVVAHAIGDVARPLRVLVDRSHGQEEIWWVDDDDPVPLPLEPYVARDWYGGLSSWAFALQSTGRYRFEILRRGTPLTWGNAGNPQDLGRYAVVCIPPPERRFSRGEREALARYCEAGGDLLILGRGESAAPLNDLLVRGVLGEPSPVRIAGGRGPLEGRPGRVRGRGGPAFLEGPFGEVVGLPWVESLPLLGDPVILGDPEIAPFAPPLVIALPRGKGRVVLVGDAALALDGTPSPRPGGPVPGWESGGASERLLLNLVAWCARDPSPPTDGEPPRLVGRPTARPLSPWRGLVTWWTDEPATSRVDYGLTPALGEIRALSDLDLAHEVLLEGLRPGARYQLRVSSRDRWGNGPASSSLSLELPSAPPVGPGQVAITEVMWAGEDGGREYVELLNLSAGEIDATGWSLTDGEDEYALKGILPPAQPYLLERQEGATSAPAVEVYGREAPLLLFEDAGDQLALRDPEGRVIATANAGGGRWPAGSAGRVPASMEMRVPAEGDRPANWADSRGEEAGWRGTPGAPNAVEPAPAAIPTLGVTLTAEGARLTWDIPEGSLAEGFHIYRAAPRGLGGEGRYTRLTDAPLPGGARDYFDEEADTALSLDYMVSALQGAGEELFSEPISIARPAGERGGPLRATLAQNFPNPFNPSTEISFALEEVSGEPGRLWAVEVAVFTQRGHMIRLLLQETLPPGSYTAHWDGNDDGGRPLPSGSYYCQVLIRDAKTDQPIERLSRKMVLAR